MFGWIESGGGVDKYFRDTRLTDVLLRTTRTDGKVVIGNAPDPTAAAVPTAALYVCSNSVGVRRTPDAGAGWALDVGGNLRVADAAADPASSSNASAAVVTPYSVALGVNSNVYLSHLGGLHGDTVFATSLKRRTSALPGLVVLGWDRAARVVEFDFDYSASFQAGQVLRAAGRYFSVLSVDAASKARERVLLELGLYFQADAPDAFDLLAEGATLDVDVLADLPDPGASTPLYVPLRVQSYAFRALAGASPALAALPAVDVEAQLLEPRDGELLRARQMVLVLHSQGQGRPDPTARTLMLLDAAVLRDDGTALLTLRTPDGRAAAEDAIGTQLQDGSIYLVPTQTQLPTYATEADVLRGYVASAAGGSTVLRRAAGLQAVVNPLGQHVPQAQVLDRFAFVDAAGATSEQLPLALYSDPRAGLVATLPRNAPSAAHTGLRYRFAGAPMQILAADVANATTVVYTLGSLVSDLAAYENCFVYLMDHWRCGVWRVLGVYANQVKLAAVDDGVSAPVDLVQDSAQAAGATAAPRYAYAVPFKYLELTELGNGVADCSVYSSLFVGTRRKMAQGDRLTVAGPVALQNQLVFYDSNDGTSAFAQRFSAGRMDLNGSVTLCPGSVRVNAPLAVSGDVTATAYHVSSDRTIKRGVRATDPAQDLAALLRLSVREFEYRARPGETKKGLVAQEVEAVLPAAVNRSHEDFAPNVCAWARVAQRQLLDEEAASQSPRALRLLLLQLDEGQCGGEHLRIGDRLRVALAPPSGDGDYKPDAVWDVTVDSLHSSAGGEGVARIGVRAPPPPQAFAAADRVFVYGTHASYRVIDYAHLVATCISGIQALHAAMQRQSS